MSLSPIPNTELKSDYLWLSWFRQLRDWVLNKVVQKTGDTMSGSLFVTSSTTPTGFIGIRPGSTGRSGWVEFFSDTPVRQGYIGHSPTNAPFDSGNIEYVAGLHNFTGRANIADGVSSFRGLLPAVPSTTATTIHTLSQEGGYLVFSYLAGVLPTFTGFWSVGFFLYDGTGSALMAVSNGTNFTLTLSGNDIQATQISGIPQNITYKLLRVF